MLAQQISPASHAGEEHSSCPACGRGKSWSTDNADFDATSLNGLILANDWLRAGDIVYSADKGNAKLSDLIDADDIIILMSQRAAALAGDLANGYPGVSATQKGILNGALAGWIALCCEPQFLATRNVQRHALTDRDLDAAARAVIGGAL
jgi:hypothetical protein